MESAGNCFWRSSYSTTEDWISRRNGIPEFPLSPGGRGKQISHSRRDTEKIPQKHKIKQIFKCNNSYLGIVNFFLSVCLFFKLYLLNYVTMVIFFVTIQTHRQQRATADIMLTLFFRVFFFNKIVYLSSMNYFIQFHSRLPKPHF